MRSNLDFLLIVGAEESTFTPARMLNKFSILLLRSYIGPFVVTFLVAMFIFEMQFIWVYLDDLMGKGLEFWIIAKLLVYASARIVNMALPLAILMSSIMTFGALAENNELTAMKSSGASLFKIMRPLIVFSLILSVSSFVFANNVWPIANLKFRTMLFSVVQQRPALNLEEGVFYNGIEGISIRVMKKDAQSGKLSDFLIYDHRGKNRGNRTVIRAESGSMEQTEDKRFLVVTLHNGHTYDEQSEDNRRNKLRPMVSGYFEEMILRIDLSNLAFSGGNEESFRGSFDMMTILQLNRAVDSLKIRRDSTIMQMANSGIRQFHLNTGPLLPLNGNTWFYDNLKQSDRVRALNAALESSKRSKEQAEQFIEDIESREKFIRRHVIEWHRKFILASACIVLFFIGAPLGAIIRKGGLGLPTIIALGLFIVYHLLSMTGEKMAKSGIVPEWLGMWLSTCLMLPMSIWLTYKASKEATLFDKDTYRRFLRKIRIPLFNSQSIQKAQ